VSYGETGQRALVIELGEDPLDGIERVELAPQPPPEPASLGASDLVVRVKSAAVGWVDLLMTSGQYQHAPALPYCPGMEYAGEVVWKGSAVRRVSVGDAVIADPFAVGPRSLGAYQAWGGMASYAVAPEQGVVPLPPSLSFDQGASLLAAYETAYHALIHRGRLREGETVLIHGASGSTGLAAVHVAKLVGATVIATGRSPEKLAEVKAQGADHVLRTAGEGGVRRFRDDVKALTEGQGVHVVYDAVGGDVSLESLRCVRFGARFLIVGWAATPLVARGKGQRGAPNANVLPTNLIMMKSVDVLGCPAAIAAHEDPAMRRERLAAILRWANEGRIAPHVSDVFPLRRVRDAMKAKWQSRVIGACVVRPDE
jgi:NADPH2:quinone reductase